MPETEIAALSGADSTFAYSTGGRVGSMWWGGYPATKLMNDDAR